MILLRPRSNFRTQKGRRGMTLKVARSEREANIVGRSALVDALAPTFEATFNQQRIDVEDDLRRQRLDGRGVRLAIPINAVELNENRFGGDMQEALLQGISVGGDIGIRHTGVEGIDLDPNLVTDRARNWVRGPGTERIVEINRRNQRQIRRSIDRTLREDLSPNEAIRRISRNVGLTAGQENALQRFEEQLIRQRLPSPEADATVFFEDPGDRQRLIGRQLVRETIEQDVENARSRMIRERSRTILETEMQTAIQEGERQFYEEAAAEGQINRDFLEKRWFTVLDDRVCAICEPLHGIVLMFDESYSSLGFSGLNPPAHPRCRCFMEYKPVDEFGGQEDEGGPELLGPGEARQIEAGPSRRETIVVQADEVLGFLDTIEPIPDGFRFTQLPAGRFVPEDVSITVAEPQRPSFLRPVFQPQPRVRRTIEQAGVVRDVIADPRGVISGQVIERLPPDVISALGRAGQAVDVARDPRGAARSLLGRVGRAALRESQLAIRRVVQEAVGTGLGSAPRTRVAELIAIPEISLAFRRNFSKGRPRTKKGSPRTKRFGRF